MQLRESLSCILFLLLFAFQGTTQELWLETAENASLNKKFGVKFEQQLRFKDQVTEWRSVMGQLSVSYSLTKRIEFRGNYRYGVFHRKDNEHRFSGDFKCEHHFGDSDWELNYRLRYQFDQEADGEDHQYGLRNRFEFKYKLHDKVKPFWGGELFHVWDPKLLANRYRLTAGIANQVLNVFKLETYVRYEREIKSSTVDFGDLEEEASIVGFSLSYSF